MKPPSLTVAWCAAIALSLPGGLLAQSLSPRAYVVTPVHANAVNFTWSYFDGGLNFNGIVPLTGTTGTYRVPVLSYYHSFSFFGRSANVTASLPYAMGNFQGNLAGRPVQAYVSGLLDSDYRVSVNLKGGPAMPAKEFMKWKQTVLLGLSFRVIAPTGQYDPRNIINWSTNRWAFKPEFGYSQRWGHWVLDGYAGVWFYTMNREAFSIPTPVPQTMQPIGYLEGHLSRDFGKLRFWASLDSNFWIGGMATLNGVQNPDTKQVTSRIGATASFPLYRHQSLKLNYSVGSYVRFGGNYHAISIGWQYSWIGRSFEK